jgi:hypothetical protein
MSEQTDNLVLELLRRIRGSQERMELDVADLKVRISSIEQHQGQIMVMLGSLSQRMDRFDERMARVERRLDLVES